jgi:hypothetical protein
LAFFLGLRDRSRMPIELSNRRASRLTARSKAMPASRLLRMRSGSHLLRF